MDIRRIKLLFAKFQNIIDEEISLMDEKGYIIDSTNSEKVGEYDTLLNHMEINDGLVPIGDKLYCRVDTNYTKGLIVSIEGNRVENRKLLQIIRLFLSENINNLTKEDFIKGIILKEFEEDEIRELCKRFDFKYDSRAKAVVIKLSEDIIDDAESIITSMYPEEILIRLNNNTLAFIKIAKNEEACSSIEQSIYDTIFSELLYEPIIGVGIVTQELSQLDKSYEKADLLIKLGKAFSQNKKIYYYNDLLVPILIDSIDILKLKDIIESMEYDIESILMDGELLLTAAKFLENNLNISDTARKLYIHRNTLIYRLNKLQNITGLDLRSFKDAMNFNALISVYNIINNQSL